MDILPSDTIKEWRLESLSAEEQASTIERIGRLIYQALLIRALDILSETEQSQFDELLDKDTTTPEEVLDFLAKKIPTFEALRIEEINKLKSDLLVTV